MSAVCGPEVERGLSPRDRTRSPPLRRKNQAIMAENRANSITHCISFIHIIDTHLSIMRMAYKRSQGDSPPEGGWPPEVLEYDSGTNIERQYRKYQCPLRIPQYEAQSRFWKRRIAELWVRQMACPWGRLEERERGHLANDYETTIQYLTTLDGLKDLRDARTGGQKDGLPPYKRSPWPFPQITGF